MKANWSYPQEFRVFYAGKTRSGKTLAMVSLVGLHAGKVPIVFLDTKGTRLLRELRAYHVYKLQHLPKYLGDPEHIVVYHPSGIDLVAQRLDLFCQLMFERLRPGIVGIDEVGQLNNLSTRAMPGFANLYSRGEEFDVGVHAGSQRPFNVPLTALTESSIFLKFRLNRLDDRKAVANYSHELMITQIPTDADPKTRKDRNLHAAHFWDTREPDTVRFFREVVTLDED